MGHTEKGSKQLGPGTTQCFRKVTCHQPASRDPKFGIFSQQQMVAPQIHPLSAWRTDSPLPRMQDRLKGSCSRPVVGMPWRSLRNTEQSQRAPKCCHFNERTSLKSRIEATGVGKKLFTFLAVFTLFGSYLTRFQAQNHQWCHFRGHQQKHRKKQLLYDLFVFMFCLNNFFILCERTTFTQSHFYCKNLPFGGSATCMNLCRGGQTLSLFMGKLQTGFINFQKASNQFVIFLPLGFFFFFLVSGWCTQYWAIITRGGWKLQLEKRAQDMIPPHRMPGRCHWNSLSLSATRVEPIWTPSKVLKTPLFIITVKWWDIVYPDRKINSHLQNACLTVLNVIWFLFKCKMKLGSQ